MCLSPRKELSENVSLVLSEQTREDDPVSGRLLWQGGKRVQGMDGGKGLKKKINKIK